jgi:hypothetical protein
MPDGFGMLIEDPQLDLAGSSSPSGEIDHDCTAILRHMAMAAPYGSRSLESIEECRHGAGAQPQLC